MRSVILGLDPVPRLDASHCAVLIDELTMITIRAALAIRENKGNGPIDRKADGSPVGPADLASERTIRAGLARAALPLPIVSEEQARDRQMAVAGPSYFVVDPLDGTREFIAGGDDYTTNIALVTDGIPVMGVISAPALGLIWRGIVGSGAQRLAFSADGSISAPIPIRARRSLADQPIVLVSRSHLDACTRAYVEHLPRQKTIACGSSLKFCRIAEGSADLYPRLAPTHDWDIAAGHALLVAAGGHVSAPDGKSLVYGTSELLVPAFIASGFGPPAFRPKVKG